MKLFARACIFVLPLVLVFASLSNADSIVLDETTFASLPGLTLESFEGLAVTGAVPSLDAGALTIGSAGDSVRVRDAALSGMSATDGTKYVNWLANPGGGALVFTFDAPATLLGVTLTDLWDSGGNLRLGLSTNAGTSFPSAFSAVAPLGNASEVFIGLLADTPFTQLTLTNFGTALDNIGVDEVRFNVAQVNAVPEPTSLLLFGTGAAGLLANAKRRKRKIERQMPARALR